MKIFRDGILFVTCAGLFFYACSKKHDGSDVQVPPTDTTGSSTGTPVETNPANTKYKPAFQGQTRIGGVHTSVAYKADVITTALTAPWGITSLPDGRLLVSQKAGQLRIVSATGSVGNAITGLPAVDAAGQGGLFGLCLDPQFETNRMLYWVFAEDVSGGTVTSVAKGRLSTDESVIENAVVIYRAYPAISSTLQYGGRILFDQTGNLFVSTGDRSNASTRGLAQSVGATIGKVIRITPSGQPAPGNPVFTGSGALPELYSIGHRNIQGLALHPATGNLWQGELGPRGGDEINLVQPGGNYGWPVITYGIEYSGEPVGDGIQQKDGMQQPVYYWDPVISPSGMTFYKGSNVAEWENNLFVSSLSATHIDRLVIENDKVVGEERLLAAENQRFRDITQGADGALYAITDAGRLYRIDKD